MQVVPIPGPSAFLLALIGSGLPCYRFAFEGFLPDKITLAKAKLAKLRTEERTIVFYVAPHKLQKTLTLIKTEFGERKACVARELTKLHEQFMRGTISELQLMTSSSQIRGECVLVIAGAEQETEPSPLVGSTEEQVRNAIKEMLSRGLGVKEISTKCSKQFGLRSSIVYQLALACIKEEKSRRTSAR
jgi:16S rRNA (cytidine1402-2'-O)-methyltransferase